MKRITKEDKATADSVVVKMLDEALSGDKSPQEVYNEIQTTASNKKVARIDDELCGDADEQPNIEVAPTYSSGETKSTEDMELERQAREEHARSVVNTNKTYFSNEQESKPISSSDCNKYFSDENISSIEKALNAFAERVAKRTKMEQEAFKKAAASEKRTWASDEITYAKNKYTDADGNVKEYKLAVKKMDIDEMIGRSVKSPEEAIERLKQYITYCIRNQYGGFNRIKTIVVSGETLIMNGVAFIPCVDAKYVRDKNIFPLDSIDLIENGTIASFFDWTTIKKMSNLYSITIDSMEFYRAEIGSSLGLGNRIGVSSLFKINDSLDVLTIGSDTVTRDSLTKDESVPMKKNLAKHKRFFNFSDGYKLNIYNGTNGLQNYMFTNLKNYAYDKGNKGTMKYAGGVVVRTGLALAAGALNLGTHVVGAIWQFGKQLFTDATTDVTEEDMQ